MYFGVLFAAMTLAVVAGGPVFASVPIDSVPGPLEFADDLHGMEEDEPPPSSAEARALLVRRRRLAARFGPVVGWLPWGVAVVDERLKILYASRKAEVVFQDSGGLGRRGTVLHVDRASVDRTLRELIRRALSREALEQDAGVIGIPDREGRMRYALRVVPYRSDPLGDVAVIAISDLAFHSNLRREVVGRLFRLSDREAELAELFAVGRRIQEIALQMDVAVSTARVHLRHVFQKTGCSNQVELARKFAMLP
jgi:DNA-binding CsgD family transcriptional regulator